MARLINAFEQFFDSAGKPLAEGKLYFRESGSSSAAKETYADSAETKPNANPVILDGDGRCPPVFGTGSYRVILTNKDSVQIVQRDPIGGEVGLEFGADWLSTTTYGVDDVARDAGEYWISLTPANLNNKPSTDGGTNWAAWPNDIDGGTATNLTSLSVAANSTGNVSRFVMSTATATLNYYAKLKTWTVSAAAEKFAAEWLHLETTGKSVIAGANITVQIRTDATGTIDVANSKVRVESKSGDSFSFTGFYLVQPAVGTVELWMKMQSAGGIVHVQELSANNQADASQYNDGATWQPGAPSGTTITSAAESVKDKSSISATDAELDILAGATVNTGEVNTLDESANSITGFLYSNRTYKNNDATALSVFPIHSFIGAAWSSVGPTGSGATYIWTALDNLPLDTEWIDVQIWNSAVSAAFSYAEHYIYAQYNGIGGTPTIGVNEVSYNRISVSGTSAGGIESKYSSKASIALDSTNKFEMYRTFIGSTCEGFMSLKKAGR